MEDMTDKRKNSITLCNQEGSANAQKDSMVAESTVSKNKALVSDESTLKSNSKEVVTEKSSSKTKAVDISQPGKRADAAAEMPQEKSIVESTVKEPLSEKVISNENKNMSTPVRHSNQANELEPISPTPLPETPSTIATALFAATANPSSMSKYHLVDSYIIS